MKLCKDCVHLNGHECVHPMNTEAQFPDFVNGNAPRQQRIFTTAQFMRERATCAGKEICGPDAKWFEAKA